MKIKLNGGKPALEQDCLALEAALGYRLSDSYRAFLRSHDGAEPDGNFFMITDKYDSSVRHFIPVDKILELRNRVDGFPRHVYPVARDGCGNFIYIDEGRGGAVFFWDHEVDLPGDTEIAPSFGAFLESLEPFDPSLIPPEPEGTGEVWIHPDYVEFLNQFRKK